MIQMNKEQNITELVVSVALSTFPQIIYFEMFFYGI